MTRMTSWRTHRRRFPLRRTRTPSLPPIESRIVKELVDNPDGEEMVEMRAATRALTWGELELENQREIRRYTARAWDREI